MKPRPSNRDRSRIFLWLRVRRHARIGLLLFGFLTFRISASAALTNQTGAATNALPDMRTIDIMSGQAFENVVARLLKTQGYEVGNLRGSNDYGVDMIANRGEERISVQVKRSKKKITRKAISDAVAGMKYYKCNKAMVVTNSEFTEDAREFGRGTDCVLVDRAILQQWLDAASKPAG